MARLLRRMEFLEILRREFDLIEEPEPIRGCQIEADATWIEFDPGPVGTPHAATIALHSGSKLDRSAYCRLLQPAVEIPKAADRAVRNINGFKHREGLLQHKARPPDLAQH
ncbi:hypothetical protein [uncultured Roseobacter sp.]|uniref:hypothetical protein n=1 Tax=uncultured Roseobacter sp. TaxID=114847 RepID=UPI002618DCE4|nr:hypothetical protein [uncultured Roseobacter sp.]